MTQKHLVRLPSGGLAPHHSEVPDSIRATGLRFVPVVTLFTVYDVKFFWCAPSNIGPLAAFRAKTKAVQVDVDTDYGAIYWCTIDMNAVDGPKRGQLTIAGPSGGELTQPG